MHDLFVICLSIERATQSGREGATNLVELLETTCAAPDEIHAAAGRAGAAQGCGRRANLCPMAAPAAGSACATKRLATDAADSDS